MIGTFTKSVEVNGSLVKGKPYAASGNGFTALG